MAERSGTASKRAELAAKKQEQGRQASRAANPAADDEEAPDDRGAVRGNLAQRAAALISGDADPGGGPEDEADDDDEGDAAGKPAPDDGQADDQADDEGDQGTPPQGELATVDDAAKQLGLTRSQFNALTVQVGAETMTLGQLKDKLPEVLKVDRMRSELDDARGTWELERLGTYRNITAIIDAIPKNAQTAGLLRQLELQHESTRQRELEALHFGRPKWADPNYATAAKQKIVALVKDYGISRAEVDGIMDHRHLLLAQDFAELREKVRASRDTARKLSEPGGNRPSGQAGAARRDDGTQSSNGSGNARHAPKSTRDNVAQRAGSILRKR